ncbi:transmembrane sensor [Pedobacter africanus]|uniref:Ferric-dicitrate binding protein FerR (Iron transport regulator) n=1 Tax=Pedobacter africanus TaxID=151894 RepID=A0ACC6KXL7_9SPHI|nr:FecR domain-containing protein [Pedobacter africanus]MDR6784105.1 ferric-dicitrate binding protein FerR (iron transport regulator) [Pedobacter africanus]
MQEDARELLLKYKKGQASTEEKAVLENWLHNFNAEADHALSDEHLQAMHQQNWTAVKQQISIRPSYRLWQKFTVAATIILCVGLAFYFYPESGNTSTPQHVKTERIIAGGSKAFLTLSNGKRIALTEADNGNLAEQSGIKITKTASGTLLYQVTAQAGQHNSRPDYNTIETPKGGEYQLILPDGSKVWLNAASALTFPANFTGLKERRVELSGEAYFEIAKNKNAPFVVKSARQELKVLGTHFNVNAYTNELATTTTLLEGSVKILKPGKTTNIILKPGQEASVDSAEIKVYETDAEEAIAWKNGLFVFNEENIRSIMKKISRWYDVEVVFKGNMDNIYFVGNYSRSKNLENLLKNIELTGKVHFKIEGRRIEVIAK